MVTTGESRTSCPSSNWILSHLQGSVVAIRRSPYDLMAPGIPGTVTAYAYTLLEGFLSVP